jgi:hypothetical protein
MALPTPNNLEGTMGWAFQGQPFVGVPTKSIIVTSNMQYAFQAQPFVIGKAAAAKPSSGGNNAAKLLAMGLI